MKAVVLLSDCQHPQTGNAMLCRVEAQAIRLAVELGAEPVGLHAGPGDESARLALGHGLDRVRHIALNAGADPLLPLAAEIAALAPDLVLAGNLAAGGQETGMLPYLLAERLGWPLVANATALLHEGDGLLADQAMAKGMRRRSHVGGPLVMTVHPAAAEPFPFAFAQARRGTLETIMPRIDAEAVATLPERPHRSRAKLIRTVDSGGGELLINPEPEDAARAILAHLRKIGVL